MKKLLFATTAIVGLATLATPAMADALEMDLGGFYRGYGVWADNDGLNQRDFDLRHDAEIHFTGETTLDNGLTVGVHAETELAGDDNTDSNLDEVYSYFSGTWGRVNLGVEDGAAYLMQVAAPSADSNVDGLRTYVQSINGATLDYAQDFAEEAQKVTYLTPKFGGFQAGVSYAPELDDSDSSVGNAISTPAADNNAGDFENLIEASARFDGAWEDVGFSVGAGYSTASTEDGAAVTADDRKAWNVGANLQFAAFEFGAAYTEDNNGVANDGDTTNWVVGLGWNNGPYTLGASYLDRELETGATTETDTDRLTVGGTYTYGPGMTFRGAVAFGEVDTGTTATSNDFTQVTLGTEINF